MSESSQPQQATAPRSFASNTMMSMASTLVYLFTRMVVPPITLHYLGVDVYGIWAFCFVIIGYLGMGAFGISNVYIRYAAIFKSQNDVQAISKLVTTGLALTLPVSVAVMVLLWFAMPWFISFFHISEANQTMAFQLFYYAAVVFLVQLATGAFDCVLTGLQQIVLSKAVNIVASILETIALYLCLKGGMGYMALIASYSVRVAFFVVATYYFMRRCLPDLRIGPKYIDRSYFSHFWGYGGAMQFNGMLTMFVGTIDRVIFLRFFGEKATGLLDIGQKFPRMAVFIPDSISGVIYPAVTHLQQGNHHDEIEKLYLRGCRYINKIIAILMGFLAAFSAPILVWWLGPTNDLSLAAFFMVLFTFPFHSHVLTGPASAVFKGLGKPFLETRYPIYKVVALVLCIGGVVMLGAPDVRSISIATAVAMTVSALAYVLYANIQLEIRLMPFLKRVFLPGLVPYAVGFGLHLLCQGWFEGVQGRAALTLRLVPIGVTYVVLNLVFLWCVAFDPADKDWIRAKLGGIGRRFGKR